MAAAAITVDFQNSKVVFMQVKLQEFHCMRSIRYIKANIASQIWSAGLVCFNLTSLFIVKTVGR